MAGSTFQAAARALNRFAREGRGAALIGTRVVGEIIMADVKASRPGHGVPVDTGALRASGKVSGPDADGVVTLSFGGAAAPYALVQHERTDFAHEVGEARYLVRGLERFEREGAQAAMRALRENMLAGIRRARRGL